MAAHRGLLLLTNVYPYDKGEEFLENEITALAGAFDHVVVVACQTGKDPVQTRELPGNVVAAHAGGARPVGVAAARATARGMVALARHERALLAAGARNPRWLAMDALFEARARAVLDELRPQLGALGVDALDEVTLYSYWLHVPARAAVLLADELARRRPQLRIDRMVSRAHRYDLYEHSAPLHHIPMRELLLARFDAVHPVSDDGTAYLHERHPRWAAKVSTRRLGTPDPGELVRAGRHPFHVVSCSFLLPVKRVDRFVGVLGLLREAGVDVRWTHFGSGEGLDELRERAAAALGPDRAQLPGYVRNAELPQRYRELGPSVFVNLSQSEGLPVSIMEATALGLPVVATDVGGVREIVTEPGCLVPEEFTDREAADALLRLARLEEDAYQELCRRVRQVWQERFDMAEVYPAFAAELSGTAPPAD